MRIGRRQLIAALVVGALVALPASSVALAASGQPSGKPTGNRQAIALFARVLRTYTKIPGVVFTETDGKSRIRFTLELGGGQVVAERATVWTKTKTVELVRPAGPVTYARAVGARCWRTVYPPSSEQLNDVGTTFLGLSAIRLQRPTVTKTGWQLVGTRKQDGLRIVFTIERPTLLVRSFTITTRTSHVVAQLAPLLTRPRIVAPKPHC